MVPPDPRLDDDLFLKISAADETGLKNLERRWKAVKRLPLKSTIRRDFLEVVKERNAALEKVCGHAGFSFFCS